MVESIDELRTEEEAGFYAWLLQIAQGKISRAIRNKSRNERKHIPLPGVKTSEHASSIELIATDMVSNPVELHEWRETLEEVGMAMGSLSAEQQVIVVGRFLAGQKIEDLAQALGKQPGAVRIMQFRALNTLAKHLGLARGSHRKRKGERI